MPTTNTLQNSESLDKLGFSEIRFFLAKYCLGSEAQKLAMDLIPSTDFELVQNELDRVFEMTQINENDDALPFNRLPELSNAFAKLAIEGMFLQGLEFREINTWLLQFKKLISFFRSRNNKYPLLSSWFSPITFDFKVCEKIDQIIDDEGVVKSNASVKLQQIRREYVSKNSSLKILLTRILRNAQSEGWTDASEITFRNDRMVIPIKTDFKGKIQGFVQDISSSGNTVFLEPTESLSLNNSVRELQIAEYNEICKILLDLTNFIRPLKDHFIEIHEIYTQLDLIHAKANLSGEFRGNKPKLSENHYELRDAKHPLLIKRIGKEAVIGLNLGLDKEKRILVISGPNAGGKSIALKTMGLLPLLVQSGIFPPASADSTFPVFDQIFVDIGDDQSIANDLSTYSSHLKKMNEMGENLSKRSLFLVDEMGSGTDPMLGGPMAEAFLEVFITKNCFGIVTTHFSNLKHFAENHPNLTNGAMLFDHKSLKPSYMFMQGMPGNSYTLEIANKMGVNPKTIELAVSKMGKKEVETENLLLNIKTQQAELKTLLIQNETKSKELEILVDNNKQLKSTLEKTRKQIINDAKAKAKQLIENSNEKIENTIRIIKEAEAEKLTTKNAREELKQVLLTLEIEPEKEKQVVKPSTDLKPGDWVQIKDREQVAQILEIKDKEALVAMGELKTMFKLKDLVKTKAPKKAKNEYQSHLNRTMSISNEIDIRGMRVEEALNQLEKYIDDIYLSNLYNFRIIHGVGTGALRKAVRQLLSKFKTFEFKDESEEFGGQGITLCQIKE